MPLQDGRENKPPPPQKKRIKTINPTQSIYHLDREYAHACVYNYYTFPAGLFFF